MFQCRYVILLVLWSITICHCESPIRNEDICGPHNGRRLYVELGEKGVLRAVNVTLEKTSRDFGRTNSSHDQCSLELVTCPSCVISVTFTSINLLHHCGDGGMTLDSPCRCDYVWISEPPYEDVSGTPFCGQYSPLSYRSNTRTLSIALLYSQFHAHAFTIEYVAERNRMILKGSNTMNEMKSMNDTGAGGILTSPFFPSRYPRDLGMEYIISCPNDSPACRVRVLFSDFQLAPVSIMEFYDWNGQRLDVSSGARFRPPIIVSTGPSMLVRFYANGGTGLGYKAFYSFVHLHDKHMHPITDCGGYVENLGGTITMMDMVGEGVKTYDCVWLIRPPKNFLHMKTHMYLKVINFADMAGNTDLVIKQGPTSALMPLEVLRHPVSQLQPPRMREHIAPITSGFHVSLRGSFGSNSRLAIAYAAFNYMDCFTGTDYLCQNHRCISNQLNCDGFDHCGDNSDEPATCLHDWDMALPDRKWQQNKANYYFPKIDRYPDLKTATLVFVGSSLGLIILISALIILLYRVGARARQQQELQSRLRTISELLDGARIDDVSTVTPDDPPVYEAPPNYDEVIKLGMDDETAVGGGSTRRKRRRTSNRNRQRSRSTPTSTCSTYEYGHRLTQSEPSYSLVIQSTIDDLMPDSPPPPYATPVPVFSGNDDHLPGPSGASNSLADRNRSENSSTDDSSPVDTISPPTSLRRSRLRDGGSFSRSLPVSRTSSTSPPVERNSSVDATPLDPNALGAYLRSGLDPAAIKNLPPIISEVTSSAQSMKSNDASNSTSTGCVNTCFKPVVHIEAGTAHPEDAEEDVEEDPERAERRPIFSAAGCQCKGACGCNRSSIIRLQRSSQVENHDSLLTNCSSPCGIFTQPCHRKRTRKSSIGSKTKVFSVSAYSSYERLHEEFEVISEKTSILANTPRNTPNKGYHSTSDLDRLYESIKAMDSILAMRDESTCRKTTVMLFRSPSKKNHCCGRHDYGTTVRHNSGDNDSTKICIWSSKDDAP